MSSETASTMSPITSASDVASKDTLGGNSSNTAPLAVVTGGTGFLGSHLCRVLSSQGWQVRSLSRRGRAAACAPEPAEGALPIEQRAVDILDPEALIAACEGADAIYHLAGRVSRDPENAGSLYEIHVKGTQSFLRAVEECQIERALYLSTSGVVAVSKRAEALTEASPYARELIGNWAYYQSKLFAEEEVMRACARGLPIKIARPSLFLGPGDPSGQSHEDLLLFLGGQLKAVPPGGINAVDVRDVAKFLPHLIEEGEVGFGYLLGGANLTARALMNQVAQITDRAPPLLDLPLNLVNRALKPLQWISSTSIGGGIDPQTFEMACHFWYLDCAAAQTLGFQTRPFSQTLLDALRDLEQRGFY